MEKIEDRPYFLSSVRNINENPNIFYSSADSLKNPLKIWVKQTAGVAADMRERFVEKNIMEEKFNVREESLALYKVMMPRSFFKQLRTFQEIEENKNKNFCLKVFGPSEIAGKSFVCLKTFATDEEAKNFMKYFNTRIITLAACMTPSFKNFMKEIPDLEDCSNNNSLFKSDEELGKNHDYFGLSLDQRLYKLFAFTDQEIELFTNENE